MSVSVTGIGLVTALGSNLSATWDAMLAGRCITEPSRADWPSATGGRSLRVVELGLAAARQAMTDAGWMNGGVDPVEVALIVATSRGAIDDWLSGDRGFGPVNQGQVDDGAGYGLAPVVDAIRQALRLGGPSLLYSSACGTGLHALIRAAMMLETGEAGRALVVAAESSMHPLFAASFKRMGVLSPASTPCRPFDKNRQGFHIAEAAAAVCLESAGTRAALSRVGAFGLGADGFHLTSPLPDGATLARLLAQVADRRQIDLFHAHGTGTELNDQVELAAIEGYAAGMAGMAGRATVYSHKGAVGHTLGAAGLVGAVLTCQMMRCGLILPNAQTFDPLPTTHVELPRGPLVRQIRHAIVLAAGFGGPQAAIRLDCPGETP